MTHILQRVLIHSAEHTPRIESTLPSEKLPCSGQRMDVETFTAWLQRDSEDDLLPQLSKYFLNRDEPANLI